MVFPLMLVVVGAAVGAKDLPVQDHVRPALVCDLRQRLMQIRGLLG